MISWMVCYYLDARTSDTICSYQFRTPQIEMHNTQDWSQELYQGLGVMANKEKIGITNVLKAIASKAMK